MANGDPLPSQDSGRGRRHPCLHTLREHYRNILIIVAVKEISDGLQDRRIFNDVVIAAITGIVGAVVGGILALVVAWIALIVSAVFIRRAYSAIAEKLGVGTFRTAGTLYLVGAATTIVLVGFLLLFVAEILQAVAYFSIPDRLPAEPDATASPVMAPPGVATKFCVNCGNKISATASFCNNCGAKQP